jgi:hypothetical protein
MPLSPLPAGVFEALNLYLHYSKCNFRPVKVKDTDVSIQISNILVLTVCFKFINFTFQILPLFVPDVTISFKSYKLMSMN